MNRTELILTSAAILFVAFMLGWFVAWLMHRFARVGKGDLGELDRLAQQLHEAEERLEEAREAHSEREKRLTSRLSQTEAELSAAMGGLRDARADAEHLRAQIEREHAGS